MDFGFWIAVSLAPKIGKQKPAENPKSKMPFAEGILDFGFWIAVSLAPKIGKQKPAENPKSKIQSRPSWQKTLSSRCKGKGNPKSKI
ncbi:MAG: hypothetical protein ABSH01_20205 [Terriglobia bacterium]